MFALLLVIEEVVRPAGALHTGGAKVLKVVEVNELLPAEQFDLTLQS